MASKAEDSSEPSFRLETELALLQQMYPDHITFNSKSRDFKYTSPNSPNATLVLRLPQNYPVDEEEPQIISASDRARNDIRNKIQEAFDTIGSDEQGSEILDVLVHHFEEVAVEAMQANLAAVSDEQSDSTNRKGVESGMKSVSQPKTVIIWTHHLLNTSKRKLAITPSYSTIRVADHGQLVPVDISGITKPGYPGIMIFSGRSDLVDAHVKELRDQMWRAFQVRYDTTEELKLRDQMTKEWEFACCRSKIVEVETMSEIVQNIVDEENKRIFLKAVGLK